MLFPSVVQYSMPICGFVIPKVPPSFLFFHSGLCKYVEVIPMQMERRRGAAAKQAKASTNRSKSDLELVDIVLAKVHSAKPLRRG